MSNESSFIDASLRNWKNTVDRASRLFEGLTDKQLETPVAAGKNRLVYLWGHLIAVHDAMLPLLGLGERRHPELDAVFIGVPDRTVAINFSKEELRSSWIEVNEALWDGYSSLSPSQWLQKHTSVSEEDFAREPHRNRYAILLGRTSHLSYHLGQAILTVRKGG